MTNENEIGQVPRRRAEDVRVTQLVNDVTTLRIDMSSVQSDLKRNTEVTEQVRDLLGTFRITAAVCKWVTIIVGSVVAVWQVLNIFKSHP